MTPYERLQVPLDCTVADVQTAFRRLSKTMHPDAGGGAEEFAALARARDILCDPLWRAHYDRTGKEESPSQEDQVKQKAIFETVGQMVADLVINQDYPLGEADVVVQLRKAVAMKQKEMPQALAKFESRLRRAEQFLERLIVKGQGEDIMGNAVRAQIAMGARQVEAMKNGMEVVDEVAALLERYGYRWEPQLVQTYTTSNASVSIFGNWA